jgi:peptide/nickel transport system substrate-binding protein
VIRDVSSTLAWHQYAVPLATAVLALSIYSTARADSEVDSIVWAGKNTIASLDPALSYDSGTNNYATYAECEALIAFDSQTKLAPWLATSWRKADDKTFIVTLRSDAKFWDGNPVTPADVVYSALRINDPKLASPVSGLASTIDAVIATGPHEVTFKLKQPDPPFAQKLATPVGQVIEKAFAEKVGADFGTAVDKVMCTGPFRPSDWSKGQKVVFDRVDNYWDSAHLPKVKQLTIQEVTDSATMVAGLKSGAITGTFDLDGRNAERLESDPALVVTAGQGTQFNYIAPVVQKGAFSDPRVRKALTYAIDRTGLARAVSGKYAQPLKAPVPPGLSSWGLDVFQQAYDAVPIPLSPDLGTAKKLITEAGADGKAGEVVVQESPTADIVGPAIQQAGASIGLHISIKKLPTADWASVNFSGQEPRPVDAILNFWAADFPDYSAVLITPFSNVYSNFEGFMDPSYRVIEDKWALTAPESKEQADLLIQMLNMLVEKAVKIPLYVDPLLMVHSKQVTGYTETKFWFYQNFAASLHGN